MRLLIPVFSPPIETWGGLTRSLALAEAAEAAGHQVAFCASGPQEAALRRRGRAVHSMPLPRVFGLPSSVSRALVKRSQRIVLPVRAGGQIGSLWSLLVMAGMAREHYLRALVRAELDAADQFGADAMLTELDPGAYIAAAVARIPMITTYASIATDGVGSWAWRRVCSAVEPVLRAHGLAGVPPQELCFSEEVLKIVPSIPALEEINPKRRDVRYVGHLLGSIQPSMCSQFPIDPDRRYVFVYVGTGSVSLSKLRRLLPRVFPADGPLKCVVGAQSIEQFSVKDGIEFWPYVPAETLLPNCDWTICHGGHNTITQSLLYGVPLIIFPGPIFERRYNARHVARAGCGVMGEHNQARPGWLREVIERQAEFAPVAAELGCRIRDYGGAPAAIRAVEEWVGARSGARSLAPR